MNEEEMALAAQELELLRAQFDNLQKQGELIHITLEEYTRARDALAELKGKSKGDKILVPIGANCWVHAVLGDPAKAIASIGSNIAVGQKVEDIIERLDRHLGEIAKAETELVQQVNRVGARMENLTAALEEAYGQLEHGHSH